MREIQFSREPAFGVLVARSCLNSDRLAVGRGGRKHSTEQGWEMAGDLLLAVGPFLLLAVFQSSQAPPVGSLDLGFCAFKVPRQRLERGLSPCLGSVRT